MCNTYYNYPINSRKGSTMIRAEEIKLYIPYIPTEAANNISSYIRGLYVRRHKYLEESEYIEEVVRILNRISDNYDPRKGHLVRYIKNTLSLKLKDYVKRVYQPTSQFNEDIALLMIISNTEAIDLSSYSDAVIEAIYNIINGKASKREIDLVDRIFKVEEK